MSRSDRRQLRTHSLKRTDRVAGPSAVHGQCAALAFQTQPRVLRVEQGNQVPLGAREAHRRRRRLQNSTAPLLRPVEAEDQQPRDPVEATESDRVRGGPAGHHGDVGHPPGQADQRLDRPSRRQRGRGVVHDGSQRAVVVAGDQRTFRVGEQRREDVGDVPATVLVHHATLAPGQNGLAVSTTVSRLNSIPGTLGRIRLTPRSCARDLAAASNPGG